MLRGADECPGVPLSVVAGLEDGCQEADEPQQADEPQRHCARFGRTTLVSLDADDEPQGHRARFGSASLVCLDARPLSLDAVVPVGEPLRPKTLPGVGDGEPPPMPWTDGAGGGECSRSPGGRAATTGSRDSGQGQEASVEVKEARMWRNKTGQSEGSRGVWSASIFGGRKGPLERSWSPGGAEVPEGRSPRSWAARSMRLRSGVSFFGMRQSVKAEETYKWQWKHRTGFKDYEEAASRRIEAVYRRGDPKVRLKTGKTKDVPMEIFFNSMKQYDPITQGERTVRRDACGKCGGGHSELQCRTPFGLRIKRAFSMLSRELETGRSRQENLESFKARRDQIGRKGDESLGPTQLSSKGSRSWSVGMASCQDWWHHWCARLVSTGWFFSFSMLAVCLSAIWIGIDADRNKSKSYYGSDASFLFMDHLFCFVFLFEIVVRFGAFRRKRDCLRDSWFRFDAFLVGLMVIDTLVMPPILLVATDGGQEGLSELAALRTARMLRLSRMARLLRYFPEVVTIAKGIKGALRSVVITLMLLLVLLYVFGIFFKTQAEVCDVEVVGWYDESVVDSVGKWMWVLLLDGTILDNPAKRANQLKKNCGFMLTSAFFLFILLSFFTLMNMLIGILCEVVANVSQSDKHESEITYLRVNLGEILECYDKDDDYRIGPQEYEQFMKNPEVLETLLKFGTDPSGLAALHEAGLIFKDDKSLTFYEFIQFVLQLKGQKAARIDDVVDFRKYLAQRWDRIEEMVDAVGTGAAEGALKAGGPGPDLGALKGQLAALAKGQTALRAQVDGLRTELRGLPEKGQH